MELFADNQRRGVEIDADTARIQRDDAPVDRTHAVFQLHRHVDFKATWPRSPQRARQLLDDAELNGLAASIRRILLSAWDPIGIEDNPVLQNEYDAFIRPIAFEINAGASADDLTSLLEAIEDIAYGFMVDATQRRRVATKLMALRQ